MASWPCRYSSPLLFAALLGWAVVPCATWVWYARVMFESWVYVPFLLGLLCLLRKTKEGNSQKKRKKGTGMKDCRGIDDSADCKWVNVLGFRSFQFRIAQIIQP